MYKNINTFKHSIQPLIQLNNIRKKDLQKRLYTLYALKDVAELLNTLPVNISCKNESDIS